ncbi:hypothetical protein A2U01_0004266 [Trifolium medium]|uniref:Uncharacterized protein n=1 Tax=Trifolium medium TaxID=97028 RepID=A0A392M8K7_9FABA|nr:hypothetical protein [Trifolium medium]
MRRDKQNLLRLKKRTREGYDVFKEAIVVDRSSSEAKSLPHEEEAIVLGSCLELKSLPSEEKEQENVNDVFKVVKILF